MARALDEALDRKRHSLYYNAVSSHPVVHRRENQTWVNGTTFDLLGPNTGERVPSTSQVSEQGAWAAADFWIG